MKTLKHMCIKILEILFVIMFTIISGIYFQHLSGNYAINHLFWNQPYLFNAYNSSNTMRNLKEVAKVDKLKQFPSRKSIKFNIKQKGHIYGWLNAMGWLTPRKYYILHFTYFSQLYPVYAPDACEAVSLRMALSAKGFHIPVSMRTFINRIPRSHNPNDGYTQSPYQYGDSATINPKGLMKYAKRYDAKIVDLTGSSKKKFVQEIKKGNPIVFEGAYQMHNTSSDHVLLLIGYRSGHPGQFLVADPFQRKSQTNKVFWVSTTDFMHIYKKSFRDEHALAVVGKLKKHHIKKHVHKRHKHIKHYAVHYVQQKPTENFTTNIYHKSIQSINQWHQRLNNNVRKQQVISSNAYVNSPKANRMAQNIPTRRTIYTPRTYYSTNINQPTYNPNYMYNNNHYNRNYVNYRKEYSHAK